MLLSGSDPSLQLDDPPVFLVGAIPVHGTKNPTKQTKKKDKKPKKKHKPPHPVWLTN